MAHPSDEEKQSVASDYAEGSQAATDAAPETAEDTAPSTPSGPSMSEEDKDDRDRYATGTGQWSGKEY